MTEKRQKSSMFKFEDSRQKRIYGNLLLIGPGPASFYQDACKLMSSDAEYSSTSHMVAHLLREIESSLRAVFKSSMLEKTPSSKEVPQNRHAEEIKAILSGIGIALDDPVSMAWLRLADNSKEYTLPKLAHRDALSRPRTISTAFCDLWDDLNQIFDYALEQFRKRFLKAIHRLDELLAKEAPSKKDGDILRNQIPNNQITLGYFLDRCGDVWLDILKESGFFASPPSLERDEEKGAIGFPPWPESRYLARMAGKKPELVLETILEVSDTDNISVLEDFAEAALAMPASLSAELAKKEATWIKRQDHLFFTLPRALGKLISHLANGGEIEAALELAGALLEIRPDPSARDKLKKNRDANFVFSPKPRVRFDEWEYEEILKKNVPDLVRVAGMQAVRMLCDLLEAAIRYSQREGSKGAPWDYSWIWRPAIEDHPQNTHRGLKSLLVTSLRDACELLIRENKESVQGLVQILESQRHRWHIFDRIVLHLLRLFPKSAKDLIAKKLTDHDLFDVAAFRHEYAMLLNDCFEMLSRDEKDKILRWIDKGPDLEAAKKRQEEFTGKRPTDEDLERHRKYWQRDHLVWFKTALPDEWKHRYEELVAELGEPEYAEFASYSAGVRVGPTSPKVAAELESMSVEEIVEFCKTWKPSDEFMAPSPEGLGRELSAVVSEKPERFLEEVARFQGLDPTYVRAFISGIRDASTKGKVFEWAPVFDLCRWVVQQPRDVVDDGDVDMLKDPHWGWARKTISDLLSAGFKEKGRRTVPFEYRETVWEVLRPITEDPEPTPEYEAEYGGANMDPTSLSINTTRGEAMHTLVRYALWVRRHLEKEPDGKERLDRSFEEMPEVREVFEAHLDIDRDSSLAIRSVYGQWFPWLVLLDSKWAAQKAGDIFLPDEQERPFWDAAWNAYVFHCHAYDNVFDILQEQYVLAVDRLIEPTKDEDSFENPQRNLGEHLMAFYWRGKLNIGEPESLLGRFWEKASPFVRGKALVFVGRNLQDTEGEVEAKILDRMKKLWESRLEEAKSAQDAAVFVSEMEAFGWWFASEKFDDKWAIEQLLEALRLVQKTDPTHLVVDRLAEVSEKFPFEAVQCLEHLAKGDQEGWKIHGWIEEAKTILFHAMESGGKAAESAEDLIHYLGSRGYLQFRSLLQRD